MVNCVYGKAMENKHNHSTVKIVLNKLKAMKLSRKPFFEQFQILSEERALFMLQNSRVKMDKSMYVGFTMLEYAKIKMYQLHYEIFSKTYPSKLTVLYTDTDSFIYKIDAYILYDDLAESDSSDILDNCDYPKDHPLYSEKNKKVQGVPKLTLDV